MNPETSVMKVADGQPAASPPPAPTGDRSANIAAALLKPSLSAAMVVQEFTKSFGGGADLVELARLLAGTMRDVEAGDLKQAEAMLFGQAHALQAIFTNLALRADAQADTKNWEACLRIGLRAQNQCRATLETLAVIKNPTVIFAKQANVNNGGQQQVNNGGLPPARASETQSAPNEVLENAHGQWLDTGAPSPAGRTNPDLEAVGAVDRATHGRGSSSSSRKRVQGRVQASAARTQCHAAPAASAHAADRCSGA